MVAENSSVCPYCKGRRVVVEPSAESSNVKEVTCPWCLGRSAAPATPGFVASDGAADAQSTDALSTEYCALMSLEPLVPNPYALLDFLRASMRFIWTLHSSNTEKAAHILNVWRQTLDKIRTTTGIDGVPPNTSLGWLFAVYALTLQAVFGRPDEESQTSA
jgi:hypothetical protein